MAVLGQGIVLMVAGMGIVYLFLWVLIVISEKSSKFVAKFDYVLPDETPKKPKRVAAAAEPAETASAAPAATPTSGEGEKVIAPVPGTVLRVSVTDGAHVSKGDELLVMDVMKMETPFSAPCDGYVTVCVAATDKVATGDTLAIVG